MVNIVSRKALIQRINRRLAREGKALRSFRSRQDRMEYGEFYTVIAETSLFLGSHADLEELGRDLGVLREGEVLDKG